MVNSVLCYAVITFCLGLATASELTDINSHPSTLSDIDCYLNEASEMIEAVRQNLPNDIKEHCKRSIKAKKPIDCSDIYEDGYHEDGIYEIWPQSTVRDGPLRVHCIMSRDGGGWTVIQRRGDFGSPKDYFYKDWQAYKTGFGDLEKDHWLGNDNTFALSKQRQYLLRFDLKDWENNSRYATYNQFWIDDEPNGYTLHVKGYRGTAGDSFTYHDGFKFSTVDNDNDVYAGNCAVLFKGAWWYKDCHQSNLNGLYLKGAHESNADGVEWLHFKGYQYSLKDTEMKIRPINFETSLNMDISPVKYSIPLVKEN